MIKRLAMLLVLLTASIAIAAEPEHTAAAGPDSQPHPTLSVDSSWGGVMVIITLFLFFLPAAVIGPIVRSMAPPPVPDSPHADDSAGAHAHEHPPKDSHAPHGHGH